MDKLAGSLAETVLPMKLRYFEWGAETLAHYTDHQKLQPELWFPSTIRFLSRGTGFEIEYEQDYDDTLWTVYFHETAGDCKERFWPVSFKRCMR